MTERIDLRFGLRILLGGPHYYFVDLVQNFQPDLIHLPDILTVQVLDVEVQIFQKDVFVDGVQHFHALEF